MRSLGFRPCFRWLSRSCFLRSQEKPLHNAYRHPYVTVYYRWHPLCGQRLRVHRQEAREHRGETLFCELPDEIVIAVPAWMTHSDAANLALGPPQPSTDALLELRALLDALRLRPVDKT